MYRLFSKTELLACIKTLSGFLQSHPTVRLVIIDSLAFHFRYSEDDGKARAKILAEVSQILISIARKFNVAVVIMNHLTSRGGSASTSEMTFALGDTWKYCCNLRLILRFSSVSKSRCAELVKSSYLELGTAPFCITTQGIRDVESEEFSFAVSSSANLVPSKRALD